MRTIHDLPKLKQNRRTLRKGMTPQERIVWARLRKEQLGVKFRRQHAMGKYIVDFYCPQKCLVIEIDGGQHFEQKEYDTLRTQHLERLGMTVLRFWNDEVNKNLEGVIFKIIQEVEK